MRRRLYRHQNRKLQRGMGRGRHQGQGRGIGRKMMQELITAQRNEITEYEIYNLLAKHVGDRKNHEVLKQIANEEKNHAKFFQDYTEKKIKPNKLKVFIHRLISKILGFTFSVKLMEKGEELAQVNYEEIAKSIPEATKIKEEEDKHERQLLNLLDEEGLKYVGSMILGVNDALVELTGALAGFTLAIQNTRLIAIIGLITGIAASLSMGASEYLSTKAEGQDKNPVKASIYTGGMYVTTVIILILPFFLFSNVLFALALTLIFALLIILFFTFYISVAQDLPFKKRFFEMAGISMGVAVLTFGIGYGVRSVFGIEV